MPLLAPPSDPQTPEAARPILRSLQQRMGVVLNFFRTLAYAPRVLQATLALDESLSHELEPKLRELAYIKTSQLNGCHY